MQTQLPKERPDCKNILQIKQKWALQKNEFEQENRDKLKSILDSNLKADCFNAYNILDSKLKHSKQVEHSNNSEIPILTNQFENFSVREIAQSSA
jgi:hypothetical protein